MANSDYNQPGLGQFTSVIQLSADIGYDSTTITFEKFNFARPEGITVGSAGMIGDEIVRVETVGVGTFTVKRGCADTIPAPHAAGTLCWFIPPVGVVRKEYSAEQTIGVKVCPFTMGGGELPKEMATPIELTFDWRFFRPYPPAQMKINAARWHQHANVSKTTGSLTLTWVDRDRVLQADQLVGQDDPTIGPEPGTTYTMRAYNAGGSLVRTEVGIRGNSFMYQWMQALHDLGYPDVAADGAITFCSNRSDLDSMQHYTATFTLDPAGTRTSDYMPFDQRLFESTYQNNVLLGLASEGNYAVAVAARPSDRMSDTYTLMSDIMLPSAQYTPWVTIDVTLRELETTLIVRSSSLYDGVPVSLTMRGQLAVIGEEFVLIESFNEDGTITLRRGCCDTVPMNHQAGTRLWFYQYAHALDPTSRGDNSTKAYKAIPNVYGPAIPAGSLPNNQLKFDLRSERPYAPGQIVVNGRPWFEEAQAVSGTSTVFSWARRNRIVAGTDPLGHIAPDMEPEDGQITRLTFHYDTPSLTAGEPPDKHILRTVSVSGVTHIYPYSQAIADGDIAGRALGVCGTVVIYVDIEAVVGTLSSWQKYTVPLRVPSYPC